MRELDGLGFSKIDSFRLIGLIKKTPLPTVDATPAAPTVAPSSATSPKANPLHMGVGTMNRETTDFLNENKLGIFAGRFQELGVSTMGSLEQLCTSPSAMEDLESIGIKRLQARGLIEVVGKAGRAEALSPRGKKAAAGFARETTKDLGSPPLAAAEENMYDAVAAAEEAKIAAAAAKAALAAAKVEEKAVALAAAKEEKIRLKLEAAKKQAEDLAAKEISESAWHVEMSKRRRGLRDVLLEGDLEDTPGKGAFGFDKWVPRYAVYNTQTRKLDIYVKFTYEPEGSYEVVQGEAINKGKAGPLGRKFRVEVKNTNFGEDDPKPWWNSFLLGSPRDAQMWTAVFNGAEIKEEDKKEEAPPEPEKPKEVAPKFLQANPWKTKEVVDANIIHTGIGAGAFSRFHSKPQQSKPLVKGQEAAARRAARKSFEGKGGVEGEEDGETPKYTIAQLFEMLDADGDGSLTLAEVVGGADKLDMSEEEATKLFKQLDRDGSGSISKDEFDKFQAPAAWDTKKAVAKPKLTPAAETAAPKFLQPVAFKIKGSEVLKPKPIEEVKPVLTDKAESAAPRYLDKVQYKIKGAKILEDAKKPIEIANFKAKEVKVLSRAPKIPVAMNRLAAAGFATYKKGSRVYAQFEDGDWYPAMVAVVRVTPTGAEEYDVEFVGFEDFEKDAYGLNLNMVAPVSEFEDNAPVARGANAEGFAPTLGAKPKYAPLPIPPRAEPPPPVSPKAKPKPPTPKAVSKPASPKAVSGLEDEDGRGGAGGREADKKVAAAEAKARKEAEKAQAAADAKAKKEEAAAAKAQAVADAKAKKEAEKAKKEAEKKAAKRTSMFSPAKAAAKSGGMSAADKARYNVADISVVLGENGLGQFADAFKDYGMEQCEDMFNLDLVADEDLKEDMGMGPEDIKSFKALAGAYAAAV